MFKFITPMLMKLAGGLVKTAKGAEDNPKSRDSTAAIITLAAVYFGIDKDGVANFLVGIGTWLKSVPSF